MNRKLYIDNLRIFLISLVVIFHLLITYSGIGGWYYYETVLDEPSVMLPLIFITTCQAFFMAMFFMISAYFMVPSYNRKGPGLFIRDRLLRLGIPLAIFYFILNPLTIFFIQRIKDGLNIGFFPFLVENKYFGFGPMWFVEALLYFSIFYLIFRLITRKSKTKTKKQIQLPKPLTIVLFSILIGIITFVVRIWLPVGWELEPLALQLPHFTQYITFVIIGIIAYHHKWFEQINYRMGLNWFIFAQVLILVIGPLLWIFGGVMEEGPDRYMGGVTWQSLGYAVWEELTGFSLIIGLTGIFRKKLNKQNRLAKSMSADAYTVYIIHAPMIVLVSLTFRNFDLHPLLKYLIVAPIALIVIFIVADVIRRLPFLRKIL